MRTFEAISGEWLQEPEQPLRPITIENMHKGIAVAHGKIDLNALARLESKRRAREGEVK
jgi:hypothetical protein